MASHLVGTHPITTFVSPVAGTSPIDANVVRGNDNTIKVAYSDGHDADATIHVQDSTNAARPAAGTAGRKWLDSDTFRVYFDDGTNWQEIAYAVSGGAGSFTSVTFTTFLKSVTALATPSALAATQFTGFASTVSGAVLMGYGTTFDVALKNRAGTDVIGITANTTGVVFAGAVSGITTLAGTGAVSGFTGVTLSGASALTGWFAAANAKGLVIANSGGSNKVAITLDGSNVWQFGDGLASVFNAGVTVSSGTTAVQALTVAGVLTYGGVALSAAVTGTGNMVLSASPTFTGTVTTAALSATTGTFTSVNTGNGVTSVPTATNTTIFTPTTPGLYLIVGYNGAAGVNCIKTLLYDGTTGIPVTPIKSSVGGDLTWSGTNVQFSHTAGSTINITWSYLRMN